MAVMGFHVMTQGGQRQGLLVGCHGVGYKSARAHNMHLKSDFFSLGVLFRIGSLLLLRLQAGDPEELVLEVVDPREKFMYGVQITSCLWVLIWVTSDMNSILASVCGNQVWYIVMVTVRLRQG